MSRSTSPKRASARVGSGTSAWPRRMARALSTPATAEGGTLTVVSFCADGGQLGTACGDGTAQVWDSATGTPLTGRLQPGGVPLSVAWSPDGTRLVAPLRAGDAVIWDARTGRPL